MKILTRTVLLCTGFCFLLAAGKSQTDVLTQHNDLARTGWNSTETQLNVSNVNKTSFGLLFNATVDDHVYAQPLIVNKVSINGNIKNVVYVCTVNNSVYAIDADNGTQYWNVNLTPGGMRVPNGDDIHAAMCSSYTDFTPTWPQLSTNFGIVGTPVIDKAANTMYLVSRYADPSKVDGTNHGGPNGTGYLSTGFHQYLHALDLSTGMDNIPPVEITATVNGTAPGSVGGKISFDPLRQNQRAGLLLLKGVIYISYAAHCDWDNYHGWMFAYNASNLHQLGAFISTPSDGRGGIWMSGGAPAAEDVGNGNIYFATGNSYDGDPTMQENRGESIVKLVPDAPGTALQNLTINDWFTPSDYVTLNQADLDFGAQILLVPNTNLLVTGAKDSYLYVLDKTNMGKFSAASNNILQKFQVGNNAGFHCSFAYFGGSTKQFVYEFAENQILSAYPVLPGGLDVANAKTGGVQGGKGQSGSYMAVSSNGTDETTGILWISNADAGCDANLQACPGVLYAVNASDVSKQLWNSNMNTGDAIAYFSKTVCPTIANGKVYLGTSSNTLNVYGLLAGNPNCTNNAAINKTALATSPTAPATNDASQAFDNNATTYWQSDAADNQSIYVDLGASYDICKVSISWLETGVAGEYYLEYTNVDPTTNPTWNSVDHETGNTLTTTEYTSAFTGRYIRMRGITRAAGSTSFGIYEMKVYGQPSVTCAAPDGLTASAITANTAHVSWTAVPNATGYNFSYQNSSIISYITRNNLTTNSVDLSALSCGSGYNYKVQAICSTGQLSDYSTGSFNAGTCTVPCSPLPTRHANADIGDIGIAGSSCYNGGVYTLKGSGTNIGGVDDQFQFMYFDESGDQSYSIRVASQDATNASNKAGVMVKQSLSNTSPFAFIGVTSGSGAVFMYRITDGGPTIAQLLPGITAPYYVEIVKTGTKYAGFVSATGSATDWQPVGTQVDLGFGSGSVSMGLAVTSADNNLLSTATFDNSAGSVVLPITLVGFSAQNINNQYVSLRWTTSMEVNNDHFTIERSGDGVKFAPIDTVKAIGNSNVNQNYTAQDNHPLSGINFYRLKQYDIDGQFGTSPAVVVNFGLNAVPSVYPNPATDNITVATGKNMIRSVTLFTVDGKQVMTADNNAALQLIHLNVSALADGLYMMEIKTDAKTYKQKLIKQ